MCASVGWMVYLPFVKNLAWSLKSLFASSFSPMLYDHQVDILFTTNTCYFHLTTACITIYIYIHGTTHTFFQFVLTVIISLLFIWRLRYGWVLLCNWWYRLRLCDSNCGYKRNRGRDRTLSIKTYRRLSGYCWYRNSWILISQKELLIIFGRDQYNVGLCLGSSTGVSQLKY